jgi:hypothetical protein
MVRPGDRVVIPTQASDGALTVPWTTLFDRGVAVGFGRTHDRRYTTMLRGDLVVSGRARPARSSPITAGSTTPPGCSGISTPAPRG